MKSAVSPAPGRITPCASAQVSSVRTTVVPTAQMRPPASRLPLMVAAASSLIAYGSACIAWRARSSTSTGLKVPGPTCRSSVATAGPVLGAGRPADVGRQRRLTVFREGRRHIERAHESHTPQPAAQHLHDLDRAVVAESDDAARLELAAGMAHREPAPVGQFADQQDLCFATRAPGPGSRDPDTAQSGRDHARHVEHEHILRRNERDDIAEVGVPQSAARAIEYEEAAGGTVGERVLGYLSRWQAVVEV